MVQGLLDLQSDLESGPVQDKLWRMFSMAKPQGHNTLLEHIQSNTAYSLQLEKVEQCDSQVIELQRTTF